MADLREAEGVFFVLGLGARRVYVGDWEDMENTKRREGQNRQPPSHLRNPIGARLHPHIGEGFGATIP